MNTNTDDLPSTTQNRVIIVLVAITVAIWIAVGILGYWVFTMEFKP